MTPGLEALQGAVTAKVVFIGVLILTLLIPLGMIEGLAQRATVSSGTCCSRRACRASRPPTSRAP